MFLRVGEKYKSFHQAAQTTMSSGCERSITTQNHWSICFGREIEKEHGKFLSKLRRVCPKVSSGVVPSLSAEFSHLIELLNYVSLVRSQAVSSPDQLSECSIKWGSRQLSMRDFHLPILQDTHILCWRFQSCVTQNVNGSVEHGKFLFPFYSSA